MILSDKDLEERLIVKPSTAEAAKTWWKEEQWKQIGTSMVIEPYERSKLSVCSYDLCVGHEYISVRNPRKIKGKALLESFSDSGKR